MNLTKIEYHDKDLTTAINFLLDEEATNKEVIRYITCDDSGMPLNNFSLWDKDLSDRATKYLQYQLEEESRDIMIDDKILLVTTKNTAYVPIYNNGELWEDNWTAPPKKVFKSRRACIEWIEQQGELDYHYTFDKTFNVWSIPIDKENPDCGEMLYPDSFYRIYRVELVEWQK